MEDEEEVTVTVVATRRFRRTMRQVSWHARSVPPPNRGPIERDLADKIAERPLVGDED